VPPESLYRLARYIDRKEVDTIFISCTNLATVKMIAAIEEEIGKPVITSNQATFWRALRMAGIPDKIEGFGRLLAEY
jgi:arylmalonate decarboxylase